MAVESLTKTTTAMNEEMKADLEQYGRIEPDSKTWVHPWETYWHWWCGKHDMKKLISEMSVKYQDFNFYQAEAHINNIIYQIINISKKQAS